MSDILSVGQARSPPFFLLFFRYPLDMHICCGAKLYLRLENCQQICKIFVIPARRGEVAGVSPSGCRCTRGTETELFMKLHRTPYHPLPPTPPGPAATDAPPSPPTSALKSLQFRLIEGRNWAGAHLNDRPPWLTAKIALNALCCATKAEGHSGLGSTTPKISG